jgi:hypothetical protein
MACGFLAGSGSLTNGQALLIDRNIVAWVAEDFSGSDAIGDPWWDDAEAGPKAADPAKPADEAGREAELMRRQYEQQGLTVLRRELSVVRQTCPSLEKQQRALVLQAGRQVIDKLVANEMDSDGRKAGKLTTAIGEALRASVAANAAAEEAAAYAAESGLREERAKQAVVAALVADVDRDAYLDDAEREVLGKALAESYRERWRPAVRELQQGSVDLGGAPLQGVERCVERSLGKERKAEWLARREEAHKLLAEAGGGRRVMINGDGRMMLQVEAQVINAGGAGGGVLRVIQQRVVNGDGVEMRLEVQGGGAGKPAAGEEEK